MIATSSGTCRQPMAAVLAGLLLFAATHRLLAAQQEGGIVGAVTDQSGAILPGVTVTATSPALQLPSVTTVTDSRGEYRLTPLPIGTFAVEYSLSGFQPVRREGIILTASFVAKIDMQLTLGTITETVTVSGASPVVDVVSTTSATRLTRETLDAIPSSRNGTVAFMGQAPGVRPQIDIGGDTITSPPVFHAFGQDNQPWQTIDGVVVSAAKSGTQGGIYWDFGNVEEAKVATFGSPAEVPTRGVLINGIVKSGSNDFHGSGFYAYQNHVLQGNNIDAALNAQGISAPGQLEFRTDYSGDLGGRLVRNKLWFYVGGRRRDQQQDTLQCFQPNGDQCFSDDRQVFNTQKVSWQVNNANKVIGFHTYAKKVSMGSGSRLTAWESRNGQQLPSHVEKGEWQAVKGNSVMISVMAGDMHWWSNFRGYACGKVLITDTVLGTTTGMSSVDGDDPDDYNHQVRGSLSWFKPDLFFGNRLVRVPVRHRLFRQLLAPERESAAPYLYLFRRPANPDHHLANRGPGRDLPAAEYRPAGYQPPEVVRRDQEPEGHAQGQRLQCAQQQRRHGPDDDVWSELRHGHQRAAAQDCRVVGGVYILGIRDWGVGIRKVENPPGYFTPHPLIPNL
jgi:hypothetical protein